MKSKRAIPTGRPIPNRRRIRAWVTALRSGKFQKTKGALGKEVNGELRHCCLGVACRVAMRQGLKLRVTQSNFNITIAFNGLSGLLPDSVAHHFGLPSCDPLITLNTRAITANDIQGWSFRRIATAIEKMYLKPRVARSTSRK